MRQAQHTTDQQRVKGSCKYGEKRRHKEKDPEGQHLLCHPPGDHAGFQRKGDLVLSHQVYEQAERGKGIQESECINEAGKIEQL